MDSMKRAQAIDLTAIGMGYFKAVEQLLYEILMVNNCEGLTEEQAEKPSHIDKQGNSE